MPDQHRELFDNLPYLIARSGGCRGQPGATLLTGDAGFCGHDPARDDICGLAFAP